MHEDLIQRAAEAFRARFGVMPTHGAIAPGRINLIGEHTDYNDGLVLPIAINRATVVLATPADGGGGDRGGGISTFVAGDLGLEVRVDLRTEVGPLPRDQPGAFANYVLGVIEEFRSLGCSIPNLNLIAHSDVPIGSGLSSSAAIEVAMATLLEVFLEQRLDPLEKALLCQRAEHAFPGTPCGIMDMYISILGRDGHAMLIDCRSSRAQPIALPSIDEMSLLVVDTGVRHDLASGEYAQRRRECRDAAAALGVSALRDATVGMLDAAREEGRIDDGVYRRAAHVVMENVRTLLAAQALVKGDIATFCAQMFESHRSLRNLYEVSCAELDLIVDTCWHVRTELGEDRIGARMTGGGFGGCAIVACPREHAATLAEVIATRFEDTFNRRPMIFPTRAASGARPIDPPTM